MENLRLDPEKTAPFELGPKDGEPCLVLHGFTGSPWDVRPLGDALAAAGYFVRGIRLPGHGLTPEAMLGVRAEDWKDAALAALEDLAQRGPVRLAGLSMGCLLSLWLAARSKEKVRGLALLAPALRFQGPLMASLRFLRNTPLLETVRPWVDKSASDIEDRNALAECPILTRFPSARLKDLFILQDLAEESLARVEVPTLVLFATQDHVVSKRGADRLMKGLPAPARARYVEVSRGYHIMPRDFGRTEVNAHVIDFFRGV